MGFIIRLSLLFLDFAWDVHNHIAWAKDLTQRGFNGFYTTVSSEVYASLYPNYPPLALLIFYPFYSFKEVISQITWWLNVTIPLFPSKLVFFIQSRLFVAGLFKLPAVCADLGIAIVCVFFARKIRPKDKKLPLLMASCILFNPAVFYNSAFWGQIDAIPIFFVLWSMYILLFTSHYIVSGLLFTLSLLVKPTTLVYLPFYTIFFIKKARPVQTIKTITASLCLFWISFIPFTQKGDGAWFPFTTYMDKIMDAQSLSFVTNGAFNFWVLITGFDGIKDTTSFLFNLSYRTWSYLIWGGLLILIIRHGLSQKDKVQAFLHVTFLSSYSAFLFLTKMHERYFLLILPMLFLVCIKERSMFGYFVTLSFLSFLNLYHSWPVPHIETFIDVLSIPFVYGALSLLNVLLFFFLFQRILFPRRHPTF